MTASVRLGADILDEGQEAFVVETPAATYCYHKEGGGFSSLVDRDGRDWIGYRAGDGPAGEYRLGAKVTRTFPSTPSSLLAVSAITSAAWP